MTASLSKVLVQEQGDTFLPDSNGGAGETAKGKFGTLIVQLPSRFVGGELVVRHNGRTRVHQCSEGAEFNVRFMTLYADVEPRMRAVTIGRRVALVYDLGVAGARAPCAKSNLNVRSYGRVTRTCRGSLAKPVSVLSAVNLKRVVRKS